MELISLEYDLATGKLESAIQKLTASQISLSYQDYLIKEQPDIRVHHTASNFAIALSVGVCLMTTMSPRDRVLVT